MGLGIREFSKRVKAICPRWYIKGGSLTVITADSRVHSIDRPIQVWEKVYSRGPGFEGDSMVMEIKESPSLLHLFKLRQGHWYRTQEMQKMIFEQSRESNNEYYRGQSRKTSYETQQYLLQHRNAFRETARRLGLSKGSMKYGVSGSRE